MTGARVQHIVVVEDDPDIRDLISDVLTDDGFRVTAVGDGETLLGFVAGHPPDLVILDLGLPGVQGLEVLRRIHDGGNVPTIVVSGKGGEADRVVGLELGADDYLVKPFSHRELLARVHAVLRRAGGAPAPRVLEFSTMSIDLGTRDVIVDGSPVELTAMEFDLLAFLASSPRQVFSPEVLLERVWGSSSDWQTPATVSEHVHRIRRKIEPDPSRPRRIETMRGAGYRFVPD